MRRRNSCGSFGRRWTSIENDDESAAFVRDLLHPQEVTMLARRIQIAKMLRQGYNYAEIALVLRTAPNTIVKINRGLDFGRGGLAKIVDRLLTAQTKAHQEQQERSDRFAWEVVKQRYALYFWPLSLMDRVEREWQELQRVRLKRTSIPPTQDK